MKREKTCQYSEQVLCKLAGPGCVKCGWSPEGRRRRLAVPGNAPNKAAETGKEAEGPGGELVQKCLEKEVKSGV